MDNKTIINYYVNYYVDKNEDRQQELDYCIEKNINNTYISDIYIIGTLIDLHVFTKRHSMTQKIHIVISGNRPKFSDFFKLINKYTRSDDINIFSNTDIYFDDSLKHVNNYLTNNTTCLALSRWDILNLEKQEIEHHDVNWSQDTWIFKGFVKSETIGNFYLGLWMCDSVLLKELLDNGYKVHNPSKTIKTYHLHCSNIRNYDRNNPVEGLVAYLEPQ